VQPAIRKRLRCPACRTPIAWQGNPHRPFCSARCRRADLGNWAAGRYRIAGDPVREDDGGDDGAASGW
jgi:uncharacterized protein